MKQLTGIGKIAICGIIATVLLSSIAYADEGAKAESIAIANANNGGDTTSIVNTGVSIYPDGNGYITTTGASVSLKAIGNSNTYGHAFGEGTTPVDPDGEQANAGINIDGYALADIDSSSRLSGIAAASASTEDLTANTFANLTTYTTGHAKADGIVDAWADVYGTGTGTGTVEIYISSVQFDSPGTDDHTNENINGEWVKITNSGSNSVDMTGWRLVDTKGHGKDKTQFDGFILASGATVTVHTGNGQNSDTDRYMGYNAYIWNNDGDTAILKDDNENIVDQKTCNQGSCEY